MRPKIVAIVGCQWLLCAVASAAVRRRSATGNAAPAAVVWPEVFGEDNAIHVNYAETKLEGGTPRRARRIPGITAYSPYGNYDDVSASRPNPFLEEEEGQRTSDLLGYVGVVPNNLTGLFEELKVVMMSIPKGAPVLGHGRA